MSEHAARIQRGGSTRAIWKDKWVYFVVVAAAAAVCCFFGESGECLGLLGWAGFSKGKLKIENIFWWARVNNFGYETVGF